MKPSSWAFCGRWPLALHQPLHQRVDDADHPHAAHHAAAARQQAELDLREAELDLRVVDGDAVVSGQRDLEAAAQRAAVDRGHDRLAERLEPAQLRLDLAHPGSHVLGVLLVRLLQVVQVTAGEEGLLRRGDDHARDVVLLGLEAIDRRAHRVLVGLVHGVRRLVRVVERQDDDAVVALLPLDRRALRGGHQTRSTTVAMPMPPPTQSVARPYRLSWRSSSSISVPRIMPPVAPSG